MGKRRERKKSVTQKQKKDLYFFLKQEDCYRDGYDKFLIDVKRNKKKKTNKSDKKGEKEDEEKGRESKPFPPSCASRTHHTHDLASCPHRVTDGRKGWGFC